MSESDKGFEEATRGIAFILLAEAFADVAEALIVADPEGGHRLLHELQVDVVTKLQRFMAEHPDLGRRDVTAAAAMQVRAVLRAAQGEADD